jgi:hypothetical protein
MRLGRADGDFAAGTRHAKWIPRGYVEPPTLTDGELVVDLIAPIAESRHSDSTALSTVPDASLDGSLTPRICYLLRHPPP